MLLILAGSSATAQARQVTAEEAMEAHRQALSIPGAKCGDTIDAEEIVVCGRSQDQYRLPLPVPPVPGQRVRGEGPSAIAATKEETCTNIGHTRGCPSLDLFGVALMVVKTVVAKVVEEAAE